MTSSRLTLVSSTALAVGAFAVAGCGNDVPSDGVAKVGDTVIKKEEFDRWIKTAVAGAEQQGGPTEVPDPPDFEKCIAAGKKQPAPQGGGTPPEDELKKQCKQQYDQLKSDVMQFLIQAEWVQQEATKQDVKVTDAEIKKQFEDQRKKQYPKKEDYQRFLKMSGLAEQDILFRLKLDALQRKLSEKVSRDQTKITDADVKEYYEKNKKRFAQPERRDLSVVLTKTKAKADEAKQALDGGQDFKAVSKKYSIDPASKARGGKLPDVPKGQQDKQVDEEVFKAKRGKLMGPVKTGFGYYLFEVTKVKAASQQSLAKATDTIRNVLKSTRQQKALDKFIKDFRDRYKDETNCADDFRVAECKNAPKDDKDKSQQAPQGGQQVPQQGAPQGGGQVPQQPQGGGAAPNGGAPPAPQGGGSQAPQQAPTP